MTRPSSTSATGPAAFRPPAWSRGDRIALLLLVVVVGGSLPFLVHPWYDRTHDGSMYLIAARSLAAGEGYTYLGQPFTIRPPGLSALLAPFVHGEEIDFRAVNALGAVFGGATVLLLFVHVRARLGAALALGTALVCWLHPGFGRLSTQVMTDVPGAALLLLALALERRARRSGPAGGLRREILLGAVVGLSTYVRAALALLVPAILLSRLLGRWLDRRARAETGASALRRLAAFALTAAAVAAPWSVRNGLVELAPPPADQTWQYSNATLLWHVDPLDPASPRVPIGELAERVPARGRELLASVGSARLVRPWGQDSREPAPGEMAVGLALTLALAIALLRRRAPGEIFVTLFAAVSLLLPGAYLDRYALPLLLFALPAAVELLRDGLRLAGRERIASAGALLALAALGVAICAPRRDWAGIERRHERLAQVCERIETHLEPDARLAAPIGWHMSVYLDRPVYTLEVATTRLGSVEGTERVVDRYGLNTVVLGEVTRQRELARYLARRYPDARTEGTSGRNVLVVRVRPN